jgi:hypothetical protein
LTNPAAHGWTFGLLGRATIPDRMDLHRTRFPGAVHQNSFFGAVRDLGDRDQPGSNGKMNGSGRLRAS